MSVRECRERNTALSGSDWFGGVGFREEAEEGLIAGSFRRWSLGGDASEGEGVSVWESPSWLWGTSWEPSGLNDPSSFGVAGGDAEVVSSLTLGLTSPPVETRSVLDAEAAALEKEPLCFLYKLFSLARLKLSQDSENHFEKRDQLHRFWNQTWEAIVGSTRGREKKHIPGCHEKSCQAEQPSHCEGSRWVLCRHGRRPREP